MSVEDDNDFLIAAEAAELMRMAKRTLDNHRCQGTGPKFRRHGGRIVYRRCDLLEWSEQRAARTAPGKRECDSASRPPIGCNSRRPPGTDKGQRPNAAVECQLKRSNRPLHVDQAVASKGPIGGSPAT